ncbi:MAG: MATE family efflux transporter, partial [Myxococcota bacterium]
MSTELPWVNRPFAELIRLSWPIAVSMLSHSAMTMVDTAFVAGIGASALAGVGLAGVAFFTLLCFSIGLLRALKILVSQAVGAKRPEQAAAYTSAGLAIAVLMGLTCTVITELSAPFISTLAASAAASDHAIIYLQIRALSAPTFLLFMALREACYGHGDARTAMVASVLANLGNAFLDYVFVVWCGWGVAGVAWATV